MDDLEKKRLGYTIAGIILASLGGVVMIGGVCSIIFIGPLCFVPMFVGMGMVVAGVSLAVVNASDIKSSTTNEFSTVTVHVHDADVEQPQSGATQLVLQSAHVKVARASIEENQAGLSAIDPDDAVTGKQRAKNSRSSVFFFKKKDRAVDENQQKKASSLRNNNVR